MTSQPNVEHAVQCTPNQRERFFVFRLSSYLPATMIQLPEILVKVNRVPAFALGVPLVLGTSSGLLTRKSVDTWYESLEKPPCEPPRRLFPVVWSVLYLSLGWASHLATSEYDLSPNAEVRDAASLLIPLHWFQLGLNLLWTPLFFGLHKPVYALVDIAALTGTVYTMTGLFTKVSKKGAWIYTAYSAWLTYAAYLNAGVVYKNQKKLFGKGSDKPNAGGGGKAAS